MKQTKIIPETIPTQEEIEAKLNDLKSDLRHIEDNFHKYCDENHISARMDHDYTWRRLILKTFPIVEYYDGSMYLGNGTDNLSREIYWLYKYPEYHIMNRINVIAFILGDNKIKVKEYALHHFRKFQMLNIEIKPKVIQEFKNGNVIIELTNKEMKNFLKVYYFTNEETNKMIEYLDNPERLTEQQKNFIVEKVKNYNASYIIHELTEQLGIKTRFLNYDLLKEKINDLVKILA